MSASEAISQKEASAVFLADNIKLVSVIEKFDPAKHKIDTCKNEFSDKYVCRIDGKKWYGTDQGLELPRTQLNQLIIYINNQPVALNVSGMFNPVFSYELNRDQFKWMKKGENILLYGFFSDGAGTYTAHWEVSGNKSTRLKISTDEEDFSWQGTIEH